MPSRPHRVALIDDEADVLTFLRFALEDRGVEVLTIDRPATALARLVEFHPDLVCLDLLMPEQMGLSLFVELRHHPKLSAVPIVILSGLNARDEMARALSREGLAPPAAYIEKPVAVSAFLETVEKALGAAVGATP